MPSFRYSYIWTETKPSEVNSIYAKVTCTHPPTQTHLPNIPFLSTPGHSQEWMQHPTSRVLWDWPNRQHTKGKNSYYHRSRTSPANGAGQPSTPWYVCVHYTCRQSLQPSTTTQAVSTHIILWMESTVTRHKTKSSLLCHSVRSYVDDHIHLIPQNSYTHL